jgi:hypothetical protein
MPKGKTDSQGQARRLPLQGLRRGIVEKEKALPPQKSKIAFDWELFALVQHPTIDSARNESACESGTGENRGNRESFLGSSGNLVGKLMELDAATFASMSLPQRGYIR